MPRWFICVFSGALGVFGACQAPPRGKPLPASPTANPAPELLGVEPPLASKPERSRSPRATPLLALSDPEALAELERRGFGFREFALGSSPDMPDNAAGYLTSERYRTLVKVLDAELAAVRTADRSAGVGLSHAHRLFDARWLRSEAFRLALVGVVNRNDRRAFAPDTCGELRLIYRLAYDTQIDGQRVSSRVPLTVNVVRWISASTPCAVQAKRWLVLHTSGAALANELSASEGALGEAALGDTLAKSVEVNLQSVRWPATVRPNMTGHAEYLLKVFRVRSDRWEEGSLENTPDLQLLAAQPNLRRELLQLLETPEALQAADLGTLQIPERFLAKRAVSVAPHGLARLANRPYQELFRLDQAVRANAEASPNFSAYRTFSSADEFVRRLDGLTCMGCHQSRSLAGFHFLGEDPPEREVDALAVPFSPHFADELSRRASYAAALVAGKQPDETRLPAERMHGGYGAHCGLAMAFSGWTCDTGFTCERLHEAQVGQCMPEQAGVGDACETGSLHPATNPHRDSVHLDRPGDCGADRHCERSGVGFPGGMCSGGCANLTDEATCGGIALLTQFNQCLARGIPFDTCVRDQTRPGSLRRCSATEPCRDDYVCARMQSGQGACIPPYFLFQLRVDGHSL